MSKKTRNTINTTRKAFISSDERQHSFFPIDTMTPMICLKETDLPFVRDRGGCRRYGDVKPPQRYGDAYVLGQQYALDLAAWLGTNTSAAQRQDKFLLARIFCAMPPMERWTGVEHGFTDAVTHTWRQGAIAGARSGLKMPDHPTVRNPAWQKKGWSLKKCFKNPGKSKAA